MFPNCHYIATAPFGADVTLVISPQDEVVDSVTGDNQAERAEQIARDHDEIFPPPELGECGA